MMRKNPSRRMKIKMACQLKINGAILSEMSKTFHCGVFQGPLEVDMDLWKSYLSC